MNLFVTVCSHHVLKISFHLSGLVKKKYTSRAAAAYRVELEKMLDIEAAKVRSFVPYHSILLFYLFL
jgi:hypothetical protein